MSTNPQPSAIGHPNPPGVTVRDMTEEEAEAELGPAPEPVDAEPRSPLERLSEALGSPGSFGGANGQAGRVEGMPNWASLPPNFPIPPGKRLVWVLFRADWTDTPAKGDRWCLMWQLSLAEEKAAYKRAQGQGEHRALEELTQQTIRVIDGVRVDRTGTLGPGNVAIWFAEVGTRCRQLLENAYLQTHTLNKAQLTDFFANCFVTNTSTTG